MTPRETPRAADAFEAYYNLGPNRSLAKLARSGQVTANLRQLEQWSTDHGWQARVAERHQEEVEAARTAAKKEAAALARRRLRNAQLLQEVGVAILAKADVMGMDNETARGHLNAARAMVVDGVRVERDELLLSASDEPAPGQADLESLRQCIIQHLMGGLSTASTRDLLQMLKAVDDLQPLAAQTLTISTITAVLPLDSHDHNTDAEAAGSM